VDLKEGLLADAREKFTRVLAIKRRLADRLGEAFTLHQLASIDMSEARFTAARDGLLRSLEIKQEIGDRVSEAATLYQLGVLAVKMERLHPAVRLVALCWQIDSGVGHADASSDFSNLSTLCRRLGYSQEQFDAMLAEASEGYAADRGWGLVRKAFPEMDDPGEAAGA
jgi:hypothetical protein